MKARLATCLALLVLATGASSPKPPPPRYLFAGVPWLVPADAARVQVEERDYHYVKAASDSQQIVLRGRMFDHDALVTGHLDGSHRLVRWVILIGSHGDPFPYPEMRAVYDEVTKESKARYGSARSIKDRFRFPYQKNDGKQDRALRDGLATIRSVWESKSGDRLTVEMDQSCSVVLIYECPEWSALEKQRQSQRGSDL